jgi:hypothetical protein
VERVSKLYPSQRREVRRPYLQAWRAKNRKKQRGYDLKHHYRATPEQVTAILNWEGGPCSACGKQMSKFGTGLDEACIDHDHSTTILRGLVCGACNRALGLVKDNIEHLQKLVAYLKGERQFSYWG